MALMSPFFSSLRKKKTPPAGALVRIGELTDLELVQELVSVAGKACASAKGSGRLQRWNSRSLVRKVKILLGLFEFLCDCSAVERLSSSTRLCFREIYILLDRSADLLAYCAQASRIWILLQSEQISGQFHDHNQDISTLLDVLPLGDLALSADVREEVELLQRQARRAKLFVDPREEALRRRIYAFIDEFDKGRTPELSDIREVFVDGLEIREASACRAEIDFLEGQICNQEEAVDLSLLQSVVALTRYARFSLFGFDSEVEDRGICRNRGMLDETGSSSSTVVPPADFCCPISLDLMRDPVIICTGQTYDRSSIVRWMEEGHGTCPYSGLPLRHTGLVPNRALRSLILQWCAANGVAYDPPEPSSPSSSATSRAAVEANRATAKLLVGQLSGGREAAKTVAAKELRLLAKDGGENRAAIAEVGAIPLLQGLLSSPNSVAQENSVTAMLNLSILEKNKGLIMEQPGCLRSIVQVLIHGRTTEARENAAATLFSLSAVHEHKKMICSEDGAVEALVSLLRHGSQRGKKDAVTALFNLSTHPDCSKKMVESGAAASMVVALTDDAVAEEAAGALALLMRQPLAAQAIAGDEAALPGLTDLMSTGTPKAKENAVAALLEMCRRGGGAAAAEKVARVPAICSLLQSLQATGTKRARRKAASLMRLCFRSQLAKEFAEYGGGRSHSSLRQGRNTNRSDVSVSVPLSVPVL